MFSVATPSFSRPLTPCRNRFFDDSGKLVGETTTDRDASETNVIALVFHYWSPELSIERRPLGTANSRDRTIDSVPFALALRSPDDLPKTIDIIKSTRDSV